MQSISEQFRSEVEGYLDASGLDATNFGRKAMSDPRFVFDLRRGRAPSARTIDKVRAWMAANPPQTTAEA
jgi:2,4-dienoyl-CoA reductase-like NADH-dependent reductase (Old Yellow Enzyme family)